MNHQQSLISQQSSELEETKKATQEFTEKIEEKEKLIDNFKTETGVNQTEIDDLKDTITDLKDTITDLKDTITELKNDGNSQSAQISEQEKLIEEFRLTNEANQKEISELQEKVKA